MNRGYRIWIPSEKKMICGANEDYNPFLLPNGRLVNYDSAHWFQDDWVRLDSTGLFDKNGKEIFDKYIIKDKYGIVHRVNFERGGFHPFTTIYYDLAYASMNIGDVCNVVDSPELCEILGNVFENPELLEVKK